ncbi:hypothetical protein OVA24_02440 [Luteolibacter sp. SL250]|uniref:hypothetical protein n=1 Tax=Luteolibacter sp. SL250 TaxID=2995170 RepID=UPI00226DB7D4|nr:hypothetical protein [Luteolibacter sp. SL250]WAC20238.1 hypothetical protein OVA24_02440 [Luteolibacter sp. SL250]
MKISVDLSEEELEEISRVTGLSKKGPAIRKLVVDALQLRRRAEISAKFLSGEYSTGLEGYEEAKASDRSEASDFAALWH